MKSRGHTQFQNQFDAVDSATPFDLMGSGKISPMTTHAAGPQLVAKKKIYKHTNATSTMSLPPGLVTPTPATMNSHMSMPMAPQMSMVRRPSFSMIHTDSGVEATLTALVMMLMTKGESMPTCWKKVVP